MNITAISVSRKSVWDQCTQLYRYKYHLKIPPPGEEPFYFTYGKLVHKISEEFVSRKGKTALGKVALLVLEGKIPIDEKNGKPVFAPSLPAAYKKRLPGHIDAIAKITKQLGTSGIVEYEFLYDLDPPNKKFVRGFIDRIIKKKDNYFILDYKTSKKKEKSENNLQMALYSEAILRDAVPGINGNPGNASLHFLRYGDDPLSSHNFSEDDLEISREKIREVANGIRTGSFETKKSDYNCQYCDYKDFICPAWED